MQHGVGKGHERESRRPPNKTKSPLYHIAQDRQQQRQCYEEAAVEQQGRKNIGSEGRRIVEISHAERRQDDEQTRPEVLVKDCFFQ